MTMVHFFADSGEAYDHSQCSDEVKDGAVLVTPDSTAILCGAWPVVVCGKCEHFHALSEGMTWDRFESGKYLNSVYEAQRFARLFGIPQEVDLTPPERGGDWF